MRGESTAVTAQWATVTTRVPGPCAGPSIIAGQDAAVGLECEGHGALVGIPEVAVSLHLEMKVRHGVLAELPTRASGSPFRTRSPWLTWSVPCRRCRKYDEMAGVVAQ